MQYATSFFRYSYQQSKQNNMDDMVKAYIKVTTSNYAKFGCLFCHHPYMQYATSFFQYPYQQPKQNNIDDCCDLPEAGWTT